MYFPWKTFFFFFFDNYSSFLIKVPKENLGKTKTERKRDVSFIYPHASVLLVKEGRTTTGSPNLLSVSQCFRIDFSDKVQNHFSTPLHPLLPLSLTLFIISSHISACSLTHNSHGCLKYILASARIYPYILNSTHEDAHDTSVKSV